jgi:hypothetical protein
LGTIFSQHLLFIYYLPINERKKERKKERNERIRDGGLAPTLVSPMWLLMWFSN